MNIYVINVQGLTSKKLTEAGTEKRIKDLAEISGLLSRKPITAIIVKRINRAMLIKIILVRLLPFLKVFLMSAQIPINIKC
jgi:hypothetical protein